MTSSPASRSQDFVWPLALLGMLCLVLIWSWIGATDRLTWWLEAFPALIVVPWLVIAHKRFPLTPLAYFLIAMHACILFVGAHYTYERVPPFNWLRDYFHLHRNDYDKLGHFAQGFVPAVFAREVLIRKRVIASRGWLAFLVMCVCMAVSACYELLEWAVALLEGSNANSFLGTQGDIWDTQSDMFCALIGAALALLLISRLHDRQIAHLKPAPES